MPIDNDDDVDIQPQVDLGLPWTISPDSGWLNYRAWVEVLLDPGMVLHKTLPQATQPVDTLATALIQDYGFTTNPDFDPAATTNVLGVQFGGIGGVNLQSQSQGQDTIQRMATSTYRFALKGEGWRAGYQIPVPGLLQVGGQTAVPCYPQWTSGNVIVGSAMGGIPIFYCTWELHYIVAGPLKGKAPIPPNLAARIRADQKLPDVIQVPFAPTDNNAVAPTGFDILRFITGK